MKFNTGGTAHDNYAQGACEVAGKQLLGAYGSVICHWVARSGARSWDYEGARREVTCGRSDTASAVPLVTVTQHAAYRAVMHTDDRT